MKAMDLAICWDYRPLDPNDEPKRPTHIDGSNGSAAPAVFTLVKTPRSPTKIETGRSGGVFSSTHGEGSFFDRDVVRQHQYYINKHKMERVCSCRSDNHNHIQAKEEIYRPRSTTRRQSNTKMEKRCKSSPNLSDLAHASQETFKDTTRRCFHENGNVCLEPKSNKKSHQQQNQNHHHHRRHHRRRSENNPNTSNECEHNRNPRLCQLPNNKNDNDIPEKVNYKQAFKAGIPNSNSSGTCTSFDSGCSSMTSSSTVSIPKMNVPKPRNPYAKKNYTISTLVPPFACWRGGAGQGGYPEHWRLASVYQHAYKPIEQRRKPLLATVYQ